MLIVVEDGNVALFLELALDLEAARRGDILKVDAAKASGDVVDRLNELVHVLGLHAEREGVHVAERLEEHALALHDGHAGLGADVAKTENGAAVGDDGSHVPAARELIAPAQILLDLETRLRNAGRIGKRKIVLRLDRHARHHFDLALPLAVEAERFFCIIHNITPPFESFYHPLDDAKVYNFRQKSGNTNQLSAI